MSETSTVHGWKIETREAGGDFYPQHAGRPVVSFSKAGRNRIDIVSRVGADTDVAIQRGKVDALQQDLDASSPDDRALWEKRLAQATAEKEDAEALRSLAAGMAHARETAGEG